MMCCVCMCVRVSGCTHDIVQKVKAFADLCTSVHAKAPPMAVDNPQVAGPKSFIDQCELLAS